MLSNEEIKHVFIHTHLDENYNFLESDLVKLANAFIEEATPKIAKKERKECIKIVKSLNSFVGDKLEEVRGKA